MYWIAYRRTLLNAVALLFFHVVLGLVFVLADRVVAARPMGLRLVPWHADDP